MRTPRHRSMLLSFAAVVAMAVTLAAQGTQHIPVNVSTSMPQSFLSTVAPDSCSETGTDVTNGSYVNSSKHLKLDGHTIVSGICQFWWNGTHVNDTIRGIYWHRFDWTPPSGSPGGQPRYPNGNNTQDYDTRNPSGGNPSITHAISNGEGQYRFDVTTRFRLTGCVILPDEVYAPQRNFHAMVCKPEWSMSTMPDYPAIYNFRAPPGPITIAIPNAGMEGARAPAAAAAAAWGTALGRSVNVQPGYATCTLSDPLCVEINDAHSGAGCASFQGSSPSSSGEWIGRGRVRLQPAWSTSHPAYVQSTIAHELGHYFGLENRLDPSCILGTTVMMGGDCYGPTAPPKGTPLGPTASDASALNNSTYNPYGSRNVCGW